MCGNENDDIAKACTNCGTRLEVNPELELKPNTPKTAKPQTTNTWKLQENPDVYQNKVLTDIYSRVANIEKNVSDIKGWITFLGILVVIGQILAFISSCSALF
jgi:polyferredoxin